MKEKHHCNGKKDCKVLRTAGIAGLGIKQVEEDIIIEPMPDSIQS